MNHWWRAHHGLPFHPSLRAVAADVGCSTAEVLAVWVAMLDKASQADERGSIAGLSDRALAAGLDLPRERVSAIRAAMQGDLLDGDRIAGWERKQVSREDETAAERKRRQRDKEGQDDASRTVTQGHAPSHDVTLDKIREEEIREESPPTPPLRGGYRFEGKVVRLKADDYDRWKRAYGGIADFDAALTAADDWIVGQDPPTRKRWFNVISPMLAKKHEAAKKAPPPRSHDPPDLPPRNSPEAQAKIDQWKAAQAAKREAELDALRAKRKAELGL